MAVETHYAELGLVQVSPNGRVYQRSQGNLTIAETLVFNTEHRILVDANLPNTSTNPTIKAYLELEAADGYQLKTVNQSFIVTEKIT